MQIQIPSHVQKLMELLENAGHQAWAVGGCVRDAFLCLTPHDWDLCTDALPEQMQEIFKDFPLVLNGVKHGTVSVITHNSMVEITTFRSEGNYADCRHPQWVHFERDIRKDLARRDFTINSMAYSPIRGLEDPWGGQYDLENHILKAVGNPEARFQEDALRILRGARFSARFSLIPDKSTMEAMNKLAPTLKHLAVERIYSELCGFLISCETQDLLTFHKILEAAIPELIPLDGFLQHNPHHLYDVYTHTAHVVGNSPRTLVSRWSALLHDIGKPATFTMSEDGIGHFRRHAQVGRDISLEILGRLRAPKALAEQVSLIINYHGSTRDLAARITDKTMAKLLRNLGEENLRILLALDRADEMGKGTPADLRPFQIFEEKLDSVLACNPCLTLHDLAIGGNDLMDIGIPQGPELGQILTGLLDEVTAGELENQRAPLLQRGLALHKVRFAGERCTP